MSNEESVTQSESELPLPHNNFVHYAAFGFGSGMAPKAPGTFGTVMGVFIYVALLQGWSPWWYLIMLLSTTAVGIYLCHRTAAELQVHDHPGIVWDEFVGYWITMFLAPSGWLWIVLGFVYFRCFDILKPWPISWLDKRVEGGFGIMVDDILAGVFAMLLLQLTALLVL
ncbi:phosphatidylglycerophosphatase A [Sinobacterium caligoides]|uniref:Phosphatidylglycerophosphatase A n=1 Tax=Sinobacterium caligoides TaxID=933926 RepID=A0A3N2DQP0_9GAMM|nr:phosphatidylglycerophosphatase A [Sinobacterium caligoides]ROS01625.1 phosphatidylglycerophosphatase A [Sinobacterium caligoides]